MSNLLKVRMKQYIQPFEYELAIRELHALGNSAITERKHDDDVGLVFELNSLHSKAALADRLTYWETVEDASGIQVTTQSLRESTINLVRNGIAIETLQSLLPFTNNIPLPNRRCLRYGTHGIHEYRGKFFPQLVRSLINISGTAKDGIVADPMSGSGTTPVEALLAGCKGRCLDMNPLSVFLGQTKCELLSADVAELANDYAQIRNELMSVETYTGNTNSYFESLPKEDQDYLVQWFSRDVLEGLDDIGRAISGVNNAHFKSLSCVALSNIIRKVSWQKVDDLRVRKEVRLDIELDPKKEFLEELGRSVRAVLAFLFQNGPLPISHFEITEGDARNCGDIWGENSVDVIITSPPYATALPYLDTDRLSLCYLGLLPRPEHRKRDKVMIGNREVTTKLRDAYWKYYQKHRNDLPDSICNLIDLIERLNADTDAGFRRLNLPALLSKYFFDMKEVLTGMRHALKPGSLAFVVVGNNHTIAGGKRVDIQTAKFLQDIAASIGFEVEASLAMEMLVSRDIYKKNAMASEEILALRKPI